MLTPENPNFDVIDITPDIASELLGHNTHNRRIRQRVVSAYAADMAEGNWRWNGEGIKFDVENILLDGQHRLLAIIESGVTVKMPVFRGLPADTQETMDGGAKRKFSDILNLRGEPHYTVLAAVTRRVHLWEAGHRRSINGGNYAPTTAQLLQTLDKHPDLRDIAKSANVVASHCSLPGSVLGLCWWLFGQLDSDDAEYFFGRLADDLGHEKGDPIYQLRKTSSESKTVRGSRSETFLTAITIKAWNFYREGETVGLLRFRPGGANPETFPEPR